MEIALRKLTIDDYTAIIRVWADAGLPYKPRGRDSRESMAREMQFPGAAYFGLFAQGKMLAVVVANWDGRRGWVNRLAVDPDYRGIGLAGRLIEESEKFLRQQGAVVMAALIHEDNSPSMTAFEKSGFVCMNDIKLFTKRDSGDS